MKINSSSRLKYKFSFPSVVNLPNDKVVDYLMKFYPNTNSNITARNDYNELKRQEK